MQPVINITRLLKTQKVKQISCNEFEVFYDAIRFILEDAGNIQMQFLCRDEIVADLMLPTIEKCGDTLTLKQKGVIPLKFN